MIPKPLFNWISVSIFRTVSSSVLEPKDLRASGPIVLLSSIEHKMDCLEYFDDLSGSPDQCCKYGMIFFGS
jgi:hypothetical protein